MINNYYTYGETWQENNLGCCVFFFCCFFKAAFLNLGHNNRSHSSQGKDAVFGIRANWTEQWCRMWISKTNVAQTSFTPTHLNTIFVSMYRLAWTFKRLKTCDFSFFLLSYFSFFLLFFFSFLLESLLFLLQTCIVELLMETKQEHATVNKFISAWTPYVM